MRSDYIEITSSPKQLKKARSFVEDFFGGKGCPSHIIGDMKIATGEALSNAVEHSGPGKAKIKVTCTQGLSHLIVEVQDNGIFKHRIEGLNGGRGYGMNIMKSLMDEVEVYQSMVGTKVTLVKICKSS